MRSFGPWAGIIAGLISGCGGASSPESAILLAPHPLETEPSCFRAPTSAETNPTPPAAALERMLWGLSQLYQVQVSNALLEHQRIIDRIVENPSADRWSAPLPEGGADHAEVLERGPRLGTIRLRYAARTSRPEREEVLYFDPQISKTEGLSWSNSGFRLRLDAGPPHRRGCIDGFSWDTQLVWDRAELERLAAECAASATGDALQCMLARSSELEAERRLICSSAGCDGDQIPNGL